MRKKIIDNFRFPKFLFFCSHCDVESDKTVRVVVAVVVVDDDKDDGEIMMMAEFVDTSYDDD